MSHDTTDLSDWPLFLVCWYPHSGGRWLNRGLLGRHGGIHLTEFFTPWLNHSVDALLGLDKTTQVHKARSLPQLRPEFDAVVRSVEAARRAGLVQYFRDKRAMTEAAAPGRRAGGALPVGSHVGQPDFALLLDILPRLTIVQLVRDPVDCFASLKSRRELDGNPHLAAAAWTQLNAAMGGFFAAPTRAANHLVVRYEDLAADPEAELRRLCPRLGLDFDPAMLEGVAEYHGRNREVDVRAAVTPEEEATIRHLTAAEAGRLGYGKEA